MPSASERIDCAFGARNGYEHGKRQRAKVATIHAREWVREGAHVEARDGVVGRQRGSRNVPDTSGSPLVPRVWSKADRATHARVRYASDCKRRRYVACEAQ